MITFGNDSVIKQTALIQGEVYSIENLLFRYLTKAGHFDAFIDLIRKKFKRNRNE